MLWLIGLVVACLFFGALVGLLTAWPAWTREARARYAEAMIARGELDRQAARVVTVEGELGDRRERIRQLEDELDAKDLLNEGLKIGLATIRDRLSDVERELAETNEALRRGAVVEDGDAAALRRRVAELEPLALVVAQRDMRIGELEKQVTRLGQQLHGGEEAGHAELVAKESEIGGLKERLAELEPLSAELSQRADEASRLEAELQERVSEVEGLRHQLAELQEVQRRVSELEQVKTELGQQEESLAAKLATQQAKLAEKDREIEDLRRRVGGLEPLALQLKERDDRIKELEVLEVQLRELEALDANLREREWQLDRLEGEPQGAALKAELARLEQRVKGLEPLEQELEARTAQIRELEAGLAAREAEAAVAIPPPAEEPTSPATTELEIPPSRPPRGRRARKGPSDRAARRKSATRRSTRRKRGRDDLKRIRGIGRVFERKLNGLGYYTFRDVAHWRKREIDRVAQELGTSPERIRGEWVMQAKQYARQNGERR